MGLVSSLKQPLARHKLGDEVRLQEYQRHYDEGALVGYEQLTPLTSFVGAVVMATSKGPAGGPFRRGSPWVCPFNFKGKVFLSQRNPSKDQSSRLVEMQNPDVCVCGRVYMWLHVFVYISSSRCVFVAVSCMYMYVCPSTASCPYSYICA